MWQKGHPALWEAAVAPSVNEDPPSDHHDLTFPRAAGSLAEGRSDSGSETELGGNK